MMLHITPLTLCQQSKTGLTLTYPLRADLSWPAVGQQFEHPYVTDAANSVAGDHAAVIAQGAVPFIIDFQHFTSFAIGNLNKGATAFCMAEVRVDGTVN